MKERISGIYYIKNIINNKLYIGQSIDVYTRLSRHKTDLRAGRDSKHLQKAYDKYGEDSFEFTILLECSEEDLDFWEKYYIKQWNTQDEKYGYNLDGGGSKSRLMSEETKVLMSQSRKGRIVSEETRRKISENHADFSGANNPNFGTIRSEQSRQKSRESNKKTWSNPELRERLRQIKIGQGTKQYYSPQLDMVFDGLKQAASYVGLNTSSKSKITDCVYGRRKSAGKHPITGEQLTWVILENKSAKQNRMKYVDQRNLALGDKNEFYIEDDSVLSVMKLSGNHHDIIRQRLGSGTVSSLNTYWAGLKVYAEFERVVTGAEDFGTFVNKMYEAYDRYVKNAIYDAMINYSEGAEVGQFKKTGTPVAADLNALCDLVSTATGNPVIIMGTRTALSKVTALQNATYISEDMKNEHYRNGVLGYWEGKELVEIPQVFEKGKVGAYKIKNDLLWIMPVSDIKFIKLVNEGEVQLHSVMDKGTNMDMTYEQEMQVKLGVGILLNSAFGVYDMEV